MAEIDTNTVIIGILGFLVFMLFLYVLRQPKLGSIKPQLLISRMNEVSEIQKALQNQTCYQCKGPMKIDTIDFFGTNEVVSKCEACGVTLTWKKEKGKGLQSGMWTLTGTTQPPGQPTEPKVMDQVRDKVAKATASPPASPPAETEKPPTPK